MMVPLFGIKKARGERAHLGPGGYTAASKSSPVTRQHDLDSKGNLLVTCGN